MSTTLPGCTLDVHLLCCCSGSLPSGRTTLLLVEGCSGRLQDDLRPHQSCPMSHAQNRVCWHISRIRGSPPRPEAARGSDVPKKSIVHTMYGSEEGPHQNQQESHSPRKNHPLTKVRFSKSRCDSCLDFVPENGGRMEAWGGR